MKRLFNVYAVPIRAVPFHYEHLPAIGVELVPVNRVP